MPRADALWGHAVLASFSGVLRMTDGAHGAEWKPWTPVYGVGSRGNYCPRGVSKRPCLWRCSGAAEGARVSGMVGQRCVSGRPGGGGLGVDRRMWRAPVAGATKSSAHFGAWTEDVRDRCPESRLSHIEGRSMRSSPTQQCLSAWRAVGNHRLDWHGASGRADAQGATGPCRRGRWSGAWRHM